MARIKDARLEKICPDYLRTTKRRSMNIALEWARDAGSWDTLSVTRAPFY